MKICGLCSTFHKIPNSEFSYFFSQAMEEINSAMFRECNGAGLVHESFVGCDNFTPSKVFYCSRYETLVNTEVCLNNQIRKMDEACLDCLQGEIVIDTMRGVSCSELK